MEEGLELFQEARIILEEEPDVRDAIADHDHPLDSESEGEALPTLWINAAVGEDIGMRHPAACDFHPLPFVSPPHVHFQARFNEGKVAGPEAKFCFRGNEFLHCGNHDGLHVGKGDVPINHHSLHLMEHGGVCGIIILPIDFSRADHAEGRSVRPHVADLYWRRMSTEQPSVSRRGWEREVEDVLGVARGVFPWKVQKIELEFLRFDLRSVSNIKSHTAEDILKLFHKTWDGVEVTAWGRGKIDREVQRILCESIPVCFPQSGALIAKSSERLRFKGIERHCISFPQIWLERRNGRECDGEDAVFASEAFMFKRIELRDILRMQDAPEEIFDRGKTLKHAMQFPRGQTRSGQEE